jgi:phosphatidate cytidylyltransferase
MARHKGAEPHMGLGVLAAAALAALLYEGHAAASGLAVTIFFLLVLVLELKRGRPAGSVANLGATVLGVFYVGWLGGHLGLLRQMPVRFEGMLEGGDSLGARLVWFTLVITWAGDSGAFFVGRWLGRRPLFPAVSPKKTVEGSIGGVAASILAGLAGGLWIVPMLGIRDSVLLGLVAGVVGPIGDLVESLLKRDFGVKDAGELIPGHGGVLDRFDSLFFVAPVVYYYLKYLVFRV